MPKRRRRRRVKQDEGGTVLATVDSAPANGKHAKQVRHARHAKNAFAKLVVSKGITLVGLAQRLNLKPQVLHTLSSSGISANHPAVPLIAAALDLSNADMAKFTKPPMREGFVGRAGRTMVATHTGQRAVVADNGKSVALVTTRGPVKYNRLKKNSRDFREVVRAMITTLNDTIMHGDVCTPPLPVVDQYLIIAELLKEKGVPETVLVDLRFLQFMDRKL